MNTSVVFFSFCLFVISRSETCCNCTNSTSNTCPFKKRLPIRKEDFIEVVLPNGHRRWMEKRRFQNTTLYEAAGVRDGERRDIYIPPVVNPSWDSTAPKFNCAILTKEGENESHLCSGALISKTFVITVGTGCAMVNGRLFSPDDIIVTLVSFNKEEGDILTYESRVNKILLHEGCCQPTNYFPQNDLALIQLLDRIFYDDYIRPATISKRNGLQHPGVKDNWDMSSLRMFHADIGSPISYKGELVGVLLYKLDCGGPRQAGLFVNIGLHSKWIRLNVQQLSDSSETV